MNSFLEIVYERLQLSLPKDGARKKDGTSSAREQLHVSRLPTEKRSRARKRSAYPLSLKDTCKLSSLHPRNMHLSHSTLGEPVQLTKPPQRKKHLSSFKDKSSPHSVARTYITPKRKGARMHDRHGGK